MASTSSVDGLVSGLDTTTIISQLMAIEKQPQDALKTKQSDANTMVAVYQALNTKFAAIQSAANSISRVADWKVMKATSSSSNVTATATSAASTGALSFTVEQLSRAGSVASTGTVASTSVVVANGPLLLARGGDAVGIGGFSAGGDLTIGTHTVEVTQATAGATQTGTSAPAASTVIGAGNNTLSVTVDGVAKTYTIADGTYTAAQLAAAVATASGGDLTAAVGSDGRLSLTTTHEGSAASLAVTGGTAAGALGLDTTAPAATGADGAVSIDGGTAIAVTSAGPGVSQVLTGANGSLTANFAGGLRLGTANLVNVDTGNGSLSTVVDAVNASGSGISAAAVNTGSGFRLQFSSTTTGANSNIAVDVAHLTAGLNAYTTVQAGRDAVIRIGEGAGSYEVRSADDTLDNVLPGVTLQLNAADPGTVVTVNVGQDGSALADKVAALVDAANQAVTFISAQSSYDPNTKQAGLLLSDGLARTLQSQVYAAVSDIVAGAKLGAPSSAGISLVKDGTITFDKSAFLTAYAKDPTAVAALFQAGGTSTDSHVSFLTASANTKAGTYAVQVTAAATQAEADGEALSGAGLVAGETIDVRIGGASGTTATYTAAAGATLDSVATGLNAAFAEKGLAVSAQVVSGKLVVRSATYGSGTSFEVRTSTVGPSGEQTGIASAAGAWEAHAGTDVAGTINGVAATGTGQVLIAPATDPTLGGIALTVNATAPGDYGTFTYTPGAAMRLNMVASAATDFANGSITNAINSQQSVIRDLTDQIADWDDRLQQKQDLLKTQFANLETALGKLRDQSNWLSGQLASLPTGGA
ncbi:MAG TPA: flagellar filament capping protein FliD [Acidimicrobiia bacterium]|nr:flagellar filament capping protein FliD [Acidimicrobiia bacterium]